jgi:hypothetical protein
MRASVRKRCPGAEPLVGAKKSPTQGWSEGVVLWSLIQRANPSGEEPMREAKPYDISKREVWEAYTKVRANQGAAGVDEQSMAACDKRVQDTRYKLWNRMASGSYVPPPVRTVKIPKANGGRGPWGYPRYQIGSLRRW